LVELGTATQAHRSAFRANVPAPAAHFVLRSAKSYAKTAESGNKRDFPASIVVVERESNFESDLVMRNLAVFDMAARLHHFEPANLPQRARRTPDGGLDRILDALFRGARDLDDSVNMVRHRHPPVGQWLGSPDLKRLQAFFLPPRSH
jgi:hypothetical protein